MQVSALAYPELTTQIPHAVDIALPRGAEKPRIEYPPVSVHWFSGPAFTSGIETPTVDGQDLRVYSAERASPTLSSISLTPFRNLPRGPESR